MTQVLDPLEALRRLGARWRPSRVERRPVERALGGFLAAPLSIPPSPRPEGSARATLNGYALPPGAGPGDYPFRSPGSGIGEEAGAGGVRLLRVETGEILPAGAERVVPVEWTSIVAGPGGGGPRVRISAGALPPRGHGLLSLEETGLEVRPGTRVEPRLLSVLLASGVTSVDVHPPLEVGILTIGRELTDVLASGPGLPGDLTGFWLPAAVRAAGHLPHPLGIIGDEPAEGRAALLRARQRKLDLVLASGGLGDGVGDRTLETLLSLGARVFFDRVAVQPGQRLLSGDWLDLRILVLGGKPLDAAAAHDLFAGPALLSASGAPPEVWDWSRRPLPMESLDGPSFPASGGEAGPSLRAAAGWPWPEAASAPGGPPGGPSGSGGPPRGRPGEHSPGGPGEPPPAGPQVPPPWRAVPLRAGPGGRWVPAGTPPSPFIPWIEGQRGWAVVPPPGPGSAARGTVEGGPQGRGRPAAYFQPCLGAVASV